MSRWKLVYAVLAAVPVVLLAFSSDPHVNGTGGLPGSSDCTSCHNTFAVNSDSRGSIRIENLSAYNPSVSQDIKLTINHPDASRWGFQLTARYVNDGSQAGTFVPTDSETKVLCDNGTTTGAPGPCDGNVFSWIEHSTAVRTTPGLGHSYQFRWIPPTQENGDIVFYYAAAAANGDNAVSGDRIYAGQTRLSLSASASCSISRKPTLRTAVNAGPHAGSIAPHAMVEVYGTDFQAGSRTRLVGAGDLGSGKFPSELSCIALEIDGQRAPIYYVQQDQINAQVPNITKTGPVSVVVVANPGRPNELRSDVGTVTIQALAPSFFTFNGTSIATRVAGKADVVANPAVVPGAAPAKPGDVVSMFGSGWGPTSPAVAPGDITGAIQAPISGTYSLTIGGVTVPTSDIQYIGLAPQSISGLYQLQVKLPASLADGDQPVVLTVGGSQSQPTATLPIKK